MRRYPIKSDDLNKRALTAESHNEAMFYVSTNRKVSAIMDRIERLVDGHELAQPGQVEALLAEAQRQVALLR